MFSDALCAKCSLGNFIILFQFSPLQTTLRKSQAEADQVEKLVEENAKTTSM